MFLTKYENARIAQAHPGHTPGAGILAREIQSTDREIDRLVYELYGLTEDEIKIVDGE